MVGETVGHYHILDKLGVGGMGIIYEAEDTRLGRHVALKFIPDNLIGDSKSLERFEREARAASQITHPNVCTIHAIEDNDGHPFIVMERLEGESLKQRIRGKALGAKEAIDIAIQVATALNALHAAGIIHRDIKPGNIFLTKDGPVKVLDFGLATLVRDHPLGMSEDTPHVEEALTAEGVVPGTAVYMSPEQARSEDVDERTDVFSLGVVLYEMVTGQKPFHGRNVVTTLDAVLHQKPRSPAEFNPALPPALVGIIGKAMEKDRRRRYQNAEQMKADLERLQKELEDGTPGSGLHHSALRLATNTFQGSNRKLVYLLLAVTASLLTVLISVGTWWWENRDSGPPAAGLNIAVLPLQNVNHDTAIDNLRFALADDISNALTDIPALAIRPSTTTQKYAGKEVDPRQVGRDLHVAIVISGHYLRQGEKLIITMEAVDVPTNTLLWQNTIESRANNLSLIQAQVVAQIRQGLLPTLRVGQFKTP